MEDICVPFSGLGLTVIFELTLKIALYSHIKSYIRSVVLVGGKYLINFTNQNVHSQQKRTFVLNIGVAITVSDLQELYLCIKGLKFYSTITFA